MTKAETYTCARCGGVFKKGWSDEEAEAEAAELFPGVSVADCDLWCDGCFKQHEDTLQRFVTHGIVKFH